MAAADPVVLTKTQSYAFVYWSVQRVSFTHWVLSHHKPDAMLNISNIGVLLFRLWDTNSHQSLAKAEAEIKSHKVWQGRVYGFQDSAFAWISYMRHFANISLRLRVFTVYTRVISSIFMLILGYGEPLVAQMPSDLILSVFISSVYSLWPTTSSTPLPNWTFW